MEYQATEQELYERAKKSLFRMVFVEGIILLVLAALSLLGFIVAMLNGPENAQPYGWVSVLYLFIPGVAMILVRRNPEMPRAQWIIRGCGLWILLSVLGFPSVLSQSPVAALITLVFAGSGLALLISSFRFSN
ncbi:MAG: hypothetical protein KDK33_00530 [Leptospiraceae bacterium]|nr:hypothetical protein [Leptospiraceae bacterium]